MVWGLGGGRRESDGRLIIFLMEKSRFRGGEIDFREWGVLGGLGLERGAC